MRGWHVQAASPAGSGPLLVHCAGGVGRTGSFVTLLSVWQDRAAIAAAAASGGGEQAVIDAVCGRVALLRVQASRVGVAVNLLTPPPAVLFETSVKTEGRAPD